MTYIQLSYGDLVLPALLVVMDGALSLILRLGLERQLAIAAVRMMLQLTLVGYVLTFLFAAVSPLWTARDSGRRSSCRLERGNNRAPWGSGIWPAVRCRRHSSSIISSWRPTVGSRPRRNASGVRSGGEARRSAGSRDRGCSRMFEAWDAISARFPRPARRNGFHHPVMHVLLCGRCGPHSIH